MSSFPSLETAPPSDAAAVASSFLPENQTFLPTAQFKSADLDPRVFDQDKFAEECAVFGIYAPPDQAAALLVYFALFNMQHRGQDATGAATSDGEEIIVHKGLGLVAQVHTQEQLQSLAGHLGIGHNRYTTSKANKLEFAQPHLERNEEGTNQLAFALNGNISNPEPMKQYLVEQGIEIAGKNDTLLMSALLWHFIQETQDIVQAIEKCWPFWIGAFSLVILWKDKLVGVRGPFGIRPLVLGKIKGESYALASESCAWNSIGKLERSVRPGEVVVIDAEGVHSHQIDETPEMLDAFELVYFARPDSAVYGKSVYQTRRNFGEELWKEHKVRADIIIPVPDTACPAAERYSQLSGIPKVDAIVKSRYVNRTFIQPTQEERELAQSFKFNIVEDQIFGRDIILIDDSMVRGTTSTPLIKKLRDAGAKSITVLIASPPVKYPDFYGVATSTQEELVAAYRSPAEVAAHIDADAVYFLSFEGMLRAIGVSEDQLMTSAFTGKYPVDIGENARHIERV